MSRPGTNQENRASDLVEALLAQAQPRPAPPVGDEQIVRAAVHEEWRTMTGVRRSRRRMRQLAAAAGVLLAAFVAFTTFHAPGTPTVEVASVSKSFGQVYASGEHSELLALSPVAKLATGQTVVTGTDAGIGLDWYGGGSLRLDENTIVEFLSADSIYLRQGRIYFDSKTQGVSAELDIETAHGSLNHLGTQYMAEVDTLTLVVSVREGQVRIGRRNGDDTASAGQRLEFVGDGRPSISNIGATASQWAWVEATAPTLDFSNRSTYEFLQWVGRETGYRVVFENDAAERLAMDGRLVGAIPGLDPRGELEVRMLGEDLDFRFDEVAGTLSIVSIDPGG